MIIYLFLMSLIIDQFNLTRWSYNKIIFGARGSERENKFSIDIGTFNQSYILMSSINR